MSKHSHIPNGEQYVKRLLFRVGCIAKISNVNNGDQVIYKLDNFERVIFVIFCSSNNYLLLLIVYTNVL